jgi:hypothetical protein
MIWLRRSLVLAPVLCFLSAALLLSCGGGKSSKTQSLGFPFSLMSLAICPGPPPTLTPTPVPTHTKSPKKTPTPMCTPIPATGFVTPTSVPINGFQFNLQGQTARGTSSKGKHLFHDFTNDQQAVWSFPSGLENAGNGLFIGLQQGCFCLNATIGSVSALTVGLEVACPLTDPTCASTTPVSCATATNCPNPTPSATPTK